MAAISMAVAEAPLEQPVVSIRRFYAPELDLLRLFAFVLVFGRHVVTGFGIALQQRLVGSAPPAAAPDHTAQASHWSLVQDLAQSLDFGVCLFFFLSSFLITTLLLMERKATGTVDVKGFYIRRALRIWPLYFVFLAVMALLSRLQPWLNITSPRFLASLLFVANWPVVLHGWIGSPIEPLWSVSVEEQFYFVWPQFARFGRAGVVGVSLVLAVLPFISIAWMASDPNGMNTSKWANGLVQCLFFAGGALTAAIPGIGQRTRSGGNRLLLFGGGWICWLTAAAACHVVHTNSPSALNLMLGYLLILAGTLLIFLSCLGWRPTNMPKSLLYLGKITFGLYVFHVFCLQEAVRMATGLLHRFGDPSVPLLLFHSVCALFALAATIGCAMLSYTILERPFLDLKKRFTVVPSRPA